MDINVPFKIFYKDYGLFDKKILAEIVANEL